MYYPLKMAPAFRYGEQTPWGGSALRDYFSKQTPGDITGESLEVSTLPGLESTVQNGAHAGKPLTEMIALWGAGLTGIEGDNYPLMLKLLDARDFLSVQVHPGDEYATEKHGKLGKSEAWVILSATPGAKIVYGVNADRAALAAAAGSSDIEGLLAWQEVFPGEVYYIPSGLVHALGGGIVVYEIQQLSDVTYRLWDFGRMGLDGKMRELHTQDAVAVAKCDMHPKNVKGATYLVEGGSVTAYICEEHFELARLNLAGRMPLSAGRMRILTPMAPCTIEYPGGALALLPGETAIIPAALSDAYLTGRAPVLMSALPDRDALIEALTYRAADVAGLWEG